MHEVSNLQNSCFKTVADDVSIVSRLRLFQNICDKKKVVQFYRPRLACCQVPVTASPTTYMYALNQSPCQHEKLLLLQQNSGRRNTYGQKMFGYNYMGHIFLRVTYWCMYTILSTDILWGNQTITIQMTAEKILYCLLFQTT